MRPDGKLRGFEFIDEKFWEISRERMNKLGLRMKLPQRATSKSAAYDIFAIEGGTIEPGKKMYFPTHVKAFMMSSEVLLMWPRSSQGIKLDLMLANTTGVIDSDYYNNPTNDGHIGIFLRNVGKEPVVIKPGDRIAQCMFTIYLIADDDNPAALPERLGGVGHTGR